MDDIGWRRSLYIGAALSIMVTAMLIILVTPPLKKDAMPCLAVNG
jgi:hypothetical protein